MFQQDVIHQLHGNWIWIPGWDDSNSGSNTAARIVRFRRFFELSSVPSRAVLHFTADTRYKLFVNGTRAAVGPARSGHSIWYYDSLDVAPFLKIGWNEVCFVVIRYFSASRSGMPFERTAYPGLTVVSAPLETNDQPVHLSSLLGWQAEIDTTTLFPMGLRDDGTLHVSLWPLSIIGNSSDTP